LRRHRLILALAALIGVAAGIAISLTRPPLPTSTAQVLLPPPQVSSTGATLRDMDTQIRIATSEAILRAAGRGVRPQMSLKSVRKHVIVTSPTEDILVVTAKAPNALAAQTLATNVANGYVKYATSQTTTANNAALKADQVQLNDANERIAKLQTQIKTVTSRLGTENPSSAKAATDTALLASLRASEGEAVLQRNAISTEINGAGNASGQGVPGAFVFQPGSVATRSSLITHRGIYGLIGFIAALLLAAIAVLTISRRGRRPRLRDEVAESIGAPVLASISSRRPRAMSHPEQLTRAFEPDVMDAWSIRKTLEEIGAFDPIRQQRLCISFITLDDDNEALGVGPQFAQFLASHDVPTSLETTINEDWAVHLRTMLSIDTYPVGSRPGLLSEDSDPALHARIALSTVDRRQPKFTHPVDPSITLLALSPGAATVSELARVALAAIDAGQRIDGVVVANPEPGDRTIGRLPQPHVSPKAPLPNRLTGTTERKWR
jgi:hypothetical protein